MPRVPFLLTMSLASCFIMSLLGFYVSIGRAESVFEEEGILVSQLDWVAPPNPSPEYLDRIEPKPSVVVPRPSRPAKGVWENLFFSGIEITTDFIKAFPTQILDMIPFPGRAIYIEHDESVPKNVQSQVYDVVHKSVPKTATGNDWSESLESQSPTFVDATPESLELPETLDFVEDGTGDLFLNGAKVKSDASIPLAPATTVIREDSNLPGSDPKLNEIDDFEAVKAESVVAEVHGNHLGESTSGKVKRDLQEIATEAGVATLKHYIKKFDLVPKMLKQILNPGTIRGGPQFNHYRDPLIFGGSRSLPQRVPQQLHYQQQRRIQQQAFYEAQQADHHVVNDRRHVFNEFQAEEEVRRPNLAYGEIGASVPRTSAF